ncbi:MAG: hypothetical protein GTN59_07290 [Candidatus Dadabacteria bacterium]|nr:hypothetical protein [Candidatus Dadabacteria bacterium]
MDKDPKETIKKIKKWIDSENYLIYRALAAGLADPRLMKSKEIAKELLDIHKKIIKKIEREKEKGDPDCKVLVKGLCYTLSVIISGIEDEGFYYLEELTKSNNPIIKKIVYENLKKNRLKRLHETKVLELQKKMQKNSITITSTGSPPATR